MLNNSTKIVVIGSNITRRSGPRVGSIGTIVGQIHPTSYDLGIPELSTVITSSNIVFSRNGYRKRKVSEIQSAVLALPILRSDGSAKKALNKAIAALKANDVKECGQTRLIVAPVMLPEVSAKDFAIKIAVKIYDSAVSSYFESLRRIRANLPIRHSMPEDKMQKQVEDTDPRILDALYVATYMRPPRSVEAIQTYLGDNIYLYKQMDRLVSSAIMMLERRNIEERNKGRSPWKRIKKLETKTITGDDRVYPYNYDNNCMYDMFRDWRLHKYDGLYYSALNDLRCELLKRGIDTINKY